MRDGHWQLLECKPAWQGSRTAAQFIAFSWELNDSRLLVAVNYGPTQGQCYTLAPWPEIGGRKVVLRDRFSDVVYERDGSDLLQKGLYLDLPAWGFNVFEVKVE